MNRPLSIGLVFALACSEPKGPSNPNPALDESLDDAPTESPEGEDDAEDDGGPPNDTAEPDDSGTADDADTSEPETPSLSDHEYAGGVERDPVDLALLELDVQDFIDKLYRYNGAIYIDAYSEVIDDWGGDCEDPIDYGYLLRYPVPSGGCTTASGIYVVGGNIDVYPASGSSVGGSIRTSFYAFYPDGTESFIGGNGLTHTYNDGASGDRRTWSSWLTGNYYNTRATDYSWMATSHTAWFVMSHAEYHTGGQYFSIEGDLEATHGDIRAFHTPGVGWSTSGECATELVDSFWVRLDDGRWLEIRSDVVSVGYGSELTGPCDGCSTVWNGETELGEICFDIAPLVWSTGSSPWPH